MSNDEMLLYGFSALSEHVSNCHGLCEALYMLRQCIIILLNLIFKATVFPVMTSGIE